MPAKWPLRTTIRNITLLNVGIGVGAIGKSIYDRLTIREEKIRTEEDNLSTDFQLKEFSRKYGLPTTSSVLPYKRHVVSYDHARRVPAWVIQHLSQNELKGDADRVHSHFKVEKRIAKIHSANNDDYSKSGYSRGHLVPAADNNVDQEAMDETFYLSNIIPQNPENNAGYWYRMEHYCRELTKRFSDVFVISGPLFLPQTQLKSDMKMVIYEVLGENQVAVPTHLFKVILAESNGVPAAIGCFIIPNEPIPADRQLRSYQVSLQHLQTVSGMSLFKSGLHHDLPQLCNVDSCRLIKQELVDLRNLSRKLKKAKTIEELEKAWTSVMSHDKWLKPSVVDIYRRKKKEFVNN